MNEPADELIAWRSIKTAPRDREVWFWIMPKSATYFDTNGNPIRAWDDSHAWFGRYKGWPALYKATLWQDGPRAPYEPTHQET